MVAKEGMGVEEVKRIVKEITRSDMMEQKIWYSLKYDGQMSMALKGDMYMSMNFKENDEHGYLYRGERGSDEASTEGGFHM